MTTRKKLPYEKRAMSAAPDHQARREEAAARGQYSWARVHTPKTPTQVANTKRRTPATYRKQATKRLLTWKTKRAALKTTL